MNSGKTALKRMETLAVHVTFLPKGLLMLLFGKTAVKKKSLGLYRVGEENGWDFPKAGKTWFHVTSLSQYMFGLCSRTFCFGSRV